MKISKQDYDAMDKTNSLHYLAGLNSSKNGEHCNASHLPILTFAWREFYRGYHAAVSDGKNSRLDSNGSLSKGFTTTKSKKRV